MSALSLTEWKTYLNARIAQEQGDDEKALRAFQELLRAHPDDAHLRSSESFAMERLGRGKESAANRIAVKYSQLATKLSGANDKPDAWTSGLSSIIQEIEQTDARGGIVSPVLMVW
jgi:Flp pilus assembly protein TadD